MKKLILSFLFVAATTVAANAQKIGYTNSMKLLSEMPAVKTADANLQALEKQLVKQGETRAAVLQKKYQEGLKKAELGQLSEADQKRIEMELGVGQQDLAKFDRESQDKLLKKREELYAPILKRVDDAIKAVALESGYVLILDASSGSLLYARETDDVSLLVKKKLGM